MYCYGLLVVNVFVEWHGRLVMEKVHRCMNDEIILQEPDAIAVKWTEYSASPVTVPPAAPQPASL